MRKYGIQTAILTMLCMYRKNLVIKEKVKRVSEGKLKNESEWEDYEESIHDDLETYFENLQGRNEIKNEVVRSFFLPKLTEEEQRMVEEKNKLQLATYYHYYFHKNPDVRPEEMKLSDSKSKFVHGRCLRITEHLALESTKDLEEDEKIPNKKIKLC